MTTANLSCSIFFSPQGGQQIWLNSLDLNVYFDLFLETRWQAKLVVRIISINIFESMFLKHHKYPQYIVLNLHVLDKCK